MSVPGLTAGISKGSLDGMNVSFLLITGCSQCTMLHASGFPVHGAEVWVFNKQGDRDMETSRSMYLCFLDPSYRRLDNANHPLHSPFLLPFRNQRSVPGPWFSKLHLANCREPVRFLIRRAYNLSLILGHFGE